jgi:hypothetical protein
MVETAEMARTKQELLDEIDELTQENADLQDQLDAVADIVAPPAAALSLCSKTA